MTIPFPHARRRSGFTLIEFLTVLAIAVVLLSLLAPPETRAGQFAEARRTARRMQNSTQVRGIHQGLATFANGNNEWYPGIKSNGQVSDATVAGRLKILLDNSFFIPDYLAAPPETDMKPWTGGPFDESHYSYALPEISTKGGRQSEWKATENSQAPAVTDRNTGDIARGEYGSIHTDKPGNSPMNWEGSIAWNDNHVTYETSANPNVHMTSARMSSTGFTTATPDDLFVAAGPDDALMIFSDTGKVVPSRAPPASSSTILILALLILTVAIAIGLFIWDSRKRKEREAQRLNEPDFM